MTDGRAAEWAELSRPLLVAHRVGNHPEQLAPAFAAGADLLEADVHLYRRRLEIRHTKTMGVLPWLWDRWYLVPAAAPRLSLDALVEQLPPGGTLMLDLKGWHPWLGRVVAAAMARVAPGMPYVVSARRWPWLDAFEPYANVRIIHSARSVREARALPRRLAAHRTDAVCVHRPLLGDPVLGPRLRSLEPLLLTWPVGSTAAAEEALAGGAQGLVVDGVDLLAEIAAGLRD